MLEQELHEVADRLAAEDAAKPAAETAPVPINWEELFVEKKEKIGERIREINASLQKGPGKKELRAFDKEFSDPVAAKAKWKQQQSAGRELSG